VDKLVTWRLASAFNLPLKPAIRAVAGWPRSS
jgi:hypothetical protein